MSQIYSARRVVRLERLGSPDELEYDRSSVSYESKPFLIYKKERNANNKKQKTAVTPCGELVDKATPGSDTVAEASSSKRPLAPQKAPDKSNLRKTLDDAIDRYTKAITDETQLEINNQALNEAKESIKAKDATIDEKDATIVRLELKLEEAENDKKRLVRHLKRQRDSMMDGVTDLLRSRSSTPVASPSWPPESPHSRLMRLSSLMNLSVMDD